VRPDGLIKRLVAKRTRVGSEKSNSTGAQKNRLKELKRENLDSRNEATRQNEMQVSKNRGTKGKTGNRNSKGGKLQRKEVASREKWIGKEKKI